MTMLELIERIMDAKASDAWNKEQSSVLLDIGGLGLGTVEGVVYKIERPGNGNRVILHYRYHGFICWGRFAGYLTNDGALEGSFSEKPFFATGEAKFSMNPDSNTASGEWKTDGFMSRAGTWTLRLVAPHCKLEA